MAHSALLARNILKNHTEKSCIIQL